MNFLIIGLATWRISSLLVQEDGPFILFVRIRNIAGVKWNELSEPYAEDFLGQLFLCVWCMSIWIGFIFSLLYLFFGQWFVWLCWPFALSAVACFVQGTANK